MRPSDRSGFQVAIICALRIESDAVESVFDEFWEEDNEAHYVKAAGDTNSYTLGRIGPHAVVLAYMPGMGKGHSATVAANFRVSFPNIRLGLVVGICGGVPQPDNGNKEIFLGDIIVSTGVVQFDFGRQLENRVIRRDTLEDNLGRPNMEIRSFLHQIQGWRARTKMRQKISTYITDICNNEEFSSWTRPPAEDDKLYKATYLHKHHAPAMICIECMSADDAACDGARDLSCEQLQCDARELVSRQRPTQAPDIHYGRMASGDLVMKSGSIRDRIATEESVLGFEMEGAGVWDNFPTIVVKAVCDYADSHKHKRWQKYASVAAAAYTKALLQEWRGVDSAAPPGALYESTKGHQSTSRDGGGGSVVFNNNGKVGNQASEQIFHGPVTFS